MGSTPFKTTYWGDNEPMYTDKLNQMTNNDQWLYENMPAAYFNSQGIRKSSGVKILSGFAFIKATASVGSATTVYFGSYFSSGCKPVVVTSINAYPQGRFHLWTRGIGTLFPDSRGFEARINVNEIDPKNNKIKYDIYVPYIAVGW